MTEQEKSLLVGLGLGWGSEKRGKSDARTRRWYWEGAQGIYLRGVREKARGRVDLREAGGLSAVYLSRMPKLCRD